MRLLCFARKDTRKARNDNGGVIPYSVMLLLLLLLMGTAAAGDAPFVGPANWGGTGLMETPTARVMKEGEFRVGVSQIDPYRYYYGAMSPLKGLEIGGRITEVLDVPALSANYGNFKDKAIDLKYQIIPEMKYLPAVAIGIMDPHGTRKYPSQYVVLSKQIYPFDFSLGFGNGRFGRKPLASQGEGIKIEMFQEPRNWLSDSQFFGGIQFAPTDYLSFMVEYSPIRYNEQTGDPAQKKYFTEAVPSAFNYGLRWKPFKWLEADLSYQRGQQVGVNLSMNFELGQPLVPIYDHPYKERLEARQSPLAVRLTRALYESGFADIAVIVDGNDLWIEAANAKYYYNARAIGVMLRILRDIVPRHVEKICLVITDNGIPALLFKTHRQDIDELSEGSITGNEFLYLSEFRTDVTDIPAGVKNHAQYVDYGIRPAFRMFLNDPSGPFKYRLGLDASASINLWKGSTFMVGAEGYPINTVSTSNKPLDRPVRSDYVYYTQETALLGSLMIDQMYKWPQEIYGRVAGGLLEVEYAGLDGEMAKPLWGGRIMVGVSGSFVKKREIGEVFAFKKNDWQDYYATVFLNTRLNIPEAEAWIDLKTGQFLAGDRGTRVTVSKSFNGVILSAWYSFTDTSVFNDNFNRGYNDKGIAITIPMSIFLGRDSKVAYSFGISPWMRDVAQDIGHAYDLFDFIGRNQKVYWDKDKRMVK